MKAVRIHEPVGIEGLVFEDAPDPVPAVGDALVKVHAASFTADELEWPIWTDRAGRARAPIIPGQEVGRGRRPRLRHHRSRGR